MIVFRYINSPSPRFIYVCVWFRCSNFTGFGCSDFTGLMLVLGRWLRNIATTGKLAFSKEGQKRQPLYFFLYWFSFILMVSLIHLLYNTYIFILMALSFNKVHTFTACTKTYIHDNRRPFVDVSFSPSADEVSSPALPLSTTVT